MDSLVSVSDRRSPTKSCRRSLTPLVGAGKSLAIHYLLLWCLANRITVITQFSKQRIQLWHGPPENSSGPCTIWTCPPARANDAFLRQPDIIERRPQDAWALIDVDERDFVPERWALATARTAFASSPDEKRRKWARKPMFGRVWYMKPWTVVELALEA